MTGMPTIDYEEREVQREITKEELDLIKPTTRIDVSKDTPFTREAEQNWLDGALNSQQLTLEEYVDIIPVNGVAPKVGLQKIIEKRKKQMEQQNQIQDPATYATQQWEAQDNIAQ